MTKEKRKKVYNVALIVIIIILIIPQTRYPIQILINKGITQIIKPSVIDVLERKQFTSYDWQLKDSFGNRFDFQTAEGKVIVINFWATWCPPCIAEMPSLEKLYRKYEDNDNIVFLFVSNEDNSVVNTFMSSKCFTFKTYQSLTEYPKELKVSSIPRTFLISKTGDILIDKSGAADWNSAVVTTAIDDLLTTF
ncbi:Thiol-disulfide isomerase or thioredoxin [Formosa sp. Hel1_31_208]|uniref:TlpA family protein disulfide reductase n=1 Tax=Formosa sp. Hel1_31_208 TaxID=1798225 RepID=UPI00087B87A6|nr:TlpA disulfide reductase family protein [Formosa sp. Hel1_31_208]SDS57634.1 Thiol-disulfide isomerase or thioredoxin [Formosa sp. Hel1_31_208]